MTKSDDAFRTISEVAKDLGLATHVLRFWESKFPQIKPLKRAGGRRYYRPDDVILLRRLQTLLHDEGYTIKGVQKLMREEGVRKLIDDGADDTPLMTTEVVYDESGHAQSSQPPKTVSVQLSAPVRPPVQQASLFDAPEPTAQTMPAQAEEAENTFASMPEPEADGFTATPEFVAEDTDTDIEASYFQNFSAPEAYEGEDLDIDLPHAPEPQPIYAPDAPEPQVIVKRSLSTTQRQKLEEILGELKALKDDIDNAA